MKPRAIVVHCSASTWGDAAVIDKWHKANGWRCIGYHGVILNGKRSYGAQYNPVIDGKYEPGRTECAVGSHCKAGGMNFCSLGVCLVGNPGWGNYPTQHQIETLVHYCADKCKQYGIPVSAITQHSDHEPAKPLCASLNMVEIRNRVAQRLKQ